MNCANCGRRIERMTTERGSLGPVTYWTHLVDGGGDTDCGLRATPPNVVLELDADDAEALLTLLEPSDPSEEHVHLYDRLRSLVGAQS